MEHLEELFIDGELTLFEEPQPPKPLLEESQTSKEKPAMPKPSRKKRAKGKDILLETACLQ